MHADRTCLPELLRRQAVTEPGRPFLQWQTEAYRSYGDVYERCLRLAGGLRDLGVQAGDTVLIMLPNGLEIIESWFACNLLGALEVPVNVFLRGAFLQHVLNDSGAAVLVVHESLVEYLSTVKATSLKALVVVGDGGIRLDPQGRELVDFEALARSAPLDEPALVTPGDVSAIYYTSGTTGPAKGIMSTYGQAIVNSRNYVRAVGARPDDVFFCCMPLFHSNAQVLQVAGPLLVGGRISVWPEFSASRWLSQVRSVGATVSNTLGVMMEFLWRQPERPDDADNPLRVLQTIPAPAALVETFQQRFDVTCIDGYGLTDVGMVAYRRHDDPLVPGSSGRPIQDFEVVIADPDTDEQLPPGTTGEIMIRPRVPFGFSRGYWGRPEETIEAWRNLWFHTGDAGVIDEDGFLYFRDRLKDSIRVKGENISSAEIEAVVAGHPSIATCAAVAVRADVGDYDVLVFAVLEPGETLEPEELVRYCEGRMPYYAVPRYVEFRPELPMTATQKIRKVELRAQGVGENTWDRVAAGHVLDRRR
jgi:crotonobetaine/carnitine-CoA ligase